MSKKFRDAIANFDKEVLNLIQRKINLVDQYQGWCQHPVVYKWIRPKTSEEDFPTTNYVCEECGLHFPSKHNHWGLFVRVHEDPGSIVETTEVMFNDYKVDYGRVEYK